MDDYIRALDITSDVLATHDTADALRLLSAGKFNCALLAKLQGQYILEQMGEKNVSPVGPAILPRDYCFAVAKGNAGLLTRLDQGLSILKNTVEYKIIQEK